MSVIINLMTPSSYELSSYGSLSTDVACPNENGIFILSSNNGIFFKASVRNVRFEINQGLVRRMYSRQYQGFDL